MRLTETTTVIGIPAPSAVLELLKPITWFPPMWAFGYGVVSSGVPANGHWPLILTGALLAGPLVCATSQVVNDWYDRGVDAINEPNRPIPSGRVPGDWGFYIALLWTVLSIGDKRCGIGSLPVQLGPERAARFACFLMALPQLVVAALLLLWGRPFYAALISIFLATQLYLMRRLLENPREKAPWYNATGVSLYVLGMLVAAFALRPALGVLP